MPSLKDLRNRIGSVKNTRKITSAMKMVAASKLRRAQEHALAGQPYAENMAKMLARASQAAIGELDFPLLKGTGNDQTYLLIVITSDRGLAGAFNTYAVREARKLILKLQRTGKTVKIITVGRKGQALLRREFPNLLINHFEELAKPRLNFGAAERVTETVLDLFNTGQFDVAMVVYNRFQSVMTQVPTSWQVIPFTAPVGNDNKQAKTEEFNERNLYDFEPSAKEILAELLPRNLSIQIYRALLDSAAGEQAARMTAMDNATRNASEMIKKQTLVYNRARQAFITKELIEIISGAEAV